MTYPLNDGEVAPKTAVRSIAAKRIQGATFCYDSRRVITESPPTSRPPCRSRSGVWRYQHAPDKDGRCVFCDKRA